MTPINFSTLKFSTSLWFSLFGRRWLFLFTGKSLPLFGRRIIQLHHLSSPPTSTGHHLLRQGSGGEHEFGKTRRRHLSSHPFSTFPISLPSTDHRPPSTVGLRRGAGICQRQALNCYLSLLHMHTHTYILCDLAWPLSARFVASTVVGKWVHSGAAADLGDAYQEQ